MQGRKHNKQGLTSTVELDPTVTGLINCECKRGYIPSLSFSTADVGLMMAFEGNIVKVNGKLRSVSWGNAKHSSSPSKIKTVVESLKGRVTLENGKTFHNWHCKDPVLYQEYKTYSGMIIDKAGEARLRKGQSTEFRIQPLEARVIRINISKFKTPENEITTLELYEGHGILLSTPLEKFSHQKGPEKDEYTVFLGAVTMSAVHTVLVLYCVPLFCPNLAMMQSDTI